MDQLNIFDQVPSIDILGIDLTVPVVILTCIVILLGLREFWCWYFKINERNNLLFKLIFLNRIRQSADELRKFTELRDEGVLNEEEFNKKKAQLLTPVNSIVYESNNILKILRFSGRRLKTSICTSCGGKNIAKSSSNTPSGESLVCLECGHAFE